MVQFVDTSHHDTGNDGGKLQSHLDSRQSNHLTDTNGQYQGINSLKDCQVLMTQNTVKQSHLKSASLLYVISWSICIWDVNL